MYSCRTGGEATRSRAILACDSGMAGKARTMIIDFHTHIFPPEVVARRAGFSPRRPLLGKVYRKPKGRPAAPGDPLGSMEAERGEVARYFPLGWRRPRLAAES